MPRKTRKNKLSTRTSKSSPSPKSASNQKPLPHLSRSSLPDADFNERASASDSGRLSTLWIIIFAFAILAVVAVLVWALLSGRSDGKIHGGNLEKIYSTSQEASGN